MQTKEIPKGETKKIGIGTKTNTSVYGMAQKNLGLFFAYWLIGLLVWVVEGGIGDYGEMEERETRGGGFYYMYDYRAYRAIHWGPYTFSVHKHFRGLFPGGIPHVD